GSAGGEQAFGGGAGVDLAGTVRGHVGPHAEGAPGGRPAHLDQHHGGVPGGQLLDEGARPRVAVGVAGHHDDRAAGGGGGEGDRGGAVAAGRDAHHLGGGAGRGEVRRQAPRHVTDRDGGRRVELHHQRGVQRRQLPLDPQRAAGRGQAEPR